MRGARCLKRGVFIARRGQNAVGLKRHSQNFIWWKVLVRFSDWGLSCVSGGTHRECDNNFAFRWSHVMLKCGVLLRLSMKPLMCRVLTWRDENGVVGPVVAVLEIWLRSTRRFRLSCTVKAPAQIG